MEHEMELNNKENTLQAEDFIFTFFYLSMSASVMTFTNALNSFQLYNQEK